MQLDVTVALHAGLEVETLVRETELIFVGQSQLAAFGLLVVAFLQNHVGFQVERLGKLIEMGNHTIIYQVLGSGSLDLNGSELLMVIVIGKHLYLNGQKRG